MKINKIPKLVLIKNKNKKHSQLLSSRRFGG